MIKDKLIPEEPSLECICKAKVLQKDYLAHTKACKHFRMIFGSLPEALEGSLKAAKDISSFKLLWHLYSNAKMICKGKMKEKVGEQIPPHEPEMPPKKIQDKSPHADISPSAIKPKENKEEEKERKREVELIGQSSVFCYICNTHFLDFNQIIYLERCLHTFCKEDLKKLIFKELPEKGVVGCAMKGCKHDLIDQEIELLVGADTAVKLRDKYTKSYLKSMKLTQCAKCQSMWEHAEGKVDYKLKDEKGVALSKVAAENYAKCRARCPKEGCNRIFCAACFIEPYHIGYTCEDFKSYQSSRKCRYCKEKIVGESASAVPAFRNVCKKADCVVQMEKACDKMLACGHPCFGFRGEKTCLPCLNEECVKKNVEKTKGQKEDDYCPICYTTSIGDSPSVMPECGHICHVDCIVSRIKKRWPGPRITFAFIECPLCRKWASAPHHPVLAGEIKIVLDTFEDIKKKAVDRLKYEGLDKDKRLHDPADKFYKKPEEYALTRLSYYMCFKCKKPYFGGLKSCENVNEGQKEYKEEDLICGACASTNIKGGVADCKQHGKEFIEFKCRFCCSVAQWFCWGTTHFCEPCHTKQCKGEYLSKKTKDQLPKCPGPEGCPLKTKHPSNGEEYSLGCAVCRNMQLNVKPF